MSVSLSVARPMQPRRMLPIVAGAIGNVLEWYDFTAYGFLAASFAANFFPLDNPILSILASYGVFAVAFIMRPLGSAVFGHIGDRISRRTALLLSVLAMAVPSFAIGLLPTYAGIGMAAPALLIVLRCVQGFSVGGELTISIVYLGEQSPAGRRGLFAGWSFVGAVVGTLCGSLLVGLLETSIGHAAVVAWGWRVPFLCSGLIGAVALLVRQSALAETSAPIARTEQAPILLAFRTEWRAMLAAFLYCIPAGAAYYLGSIYLIRFVQRFDTIPAAEADTIVSVGLVTELIALPLFAALSDRIGRRPVMIAGVVGLSLYAWPLFWLAMQPKAWVVFAAEIGFAILQSAYAGPLPATLAEQFRPDLRCTATSVSYNAAIASLGGTAPMIAVYLIARTGVATAPAWYMMGVSVAALIGLLLAPRRDSSMAEGVSAGRRI
jgi:MHS family proline/betaine transporter-like MFS transporter